MRKQSLRALRWAMYAPEISRQAIEGERATPILLPKGSASGLRAYRAPLLPRGRTSRAAAGGALLTRR